MSGMGKVLPKGEKLLVPFDSYVLFGEPTICKSADVTEIVREIEANIIELKEQFIASIREN